MPAAAGGSAPSNPSSAGPQRSAPAADGNGPQAAAARAAEVCSLLPPSAAKVCLFLRLTDARVQERAKKSQVSGGLAGQLAAQKKQNALEQASYENRRAREIDTVAQARNWN